MWRVSALDRDGREIAHADVAQGELTIGRDADRQLVLPSASISRRHARIVVGPGGLTILDEGSSNGVLVNGVRIAAPTPVGPLTHVELADYRLVIAGPPGADAGASRPAEMGGGAFAPVAIPGVPLEAGGMLPQSAGLHLVAQGGPYDGRLFPVPPAPVLQVGRAVDNDLVFDDPSLSRRHARIHRTGARLEVEDLASSNGTFVNGRRVGRAAINPGDAVRFGDLQFHLDGGGHASTGAVSGGLPRGERRALIGGSVVTVLSVLLAVFFLIRKVPPVRASGTEALAKIARQAESHFQSGKALIGERKWADARAELEAALELDPGNVQAVRLKGQAVRAPEDERAYASAATSLAIGDRKGLESALKIHEELSEGAPQRTQLATKLSTAFLRYGNQQCEQREFGECAWALCKLYDVAPADNRPSAMVERALRDAEKRLKKGTFVPCRATP